MSNTAAPRTFAVGDRVIVDPNGIGVSRTVLGQVFVVDRKGPKNIVCRPENGQGRGLRYPPELLLPAPPEGEAVPLGRPYVERPWIAVGAVVTLNSPWSDVAVDTPLICVKGGAEKVNLVRLDDTSGRYIRIDSRAVTVRDLAWLTERLVEMA